MTNYFKNFYIEADIIIESLEVIDYGRTKQRLNPPNESMRKVFEEQVSWLKLCFLTKMCYLIGVSI